jgi:hypothetical protein
MSFAGSFPSEERKESFSRQFRPGLILRLFCSFTSPPKEKRLLVVSISPEPLVFVINSEINEYKRRRSDLLKQQVCLRQSDYAFLDHNSYVDCSRVRDDFTLSEIEAIVANDPRRILGNIDSATAVEIVETVNDSVTLEPRHKNRVISDLI